MSSLEELEAAFEPKPDLPQGVPAARSSTAVTASYDDRLRTLGEKWKDALDTPGPHGYPSASEADMALIGRMVACNFSDAEVWQTLESSPRFADRADRKGERHARKLYASEIAKARTTVTPFPASPRPTAPLQVASPKSEAAEPPFVSTNGSIPQPDAPGTPLRLPQEVWRPTVDDYRLALEGVTEAADEHHFAAFVTITGSVFGRRVFVDNAYRLYPNFYTLNVGRAGSTKKTTVQRLARDVVLRVDESLTIQSAAGSGEGLLEALSEADSTLGLAPMHRRLLLMQSEMGQLLAKARQDGSGTLISLLLDVFDCPSVLNPRTRTKSITAHKPTLSLMAATTPAHLSKYAEDADWYGGLGSRLFICIAEPKEPIPRPRKVDPSRFNSVVQDIRRAIERWPQETEFKLTEEAARRWDAWYVLNKKRERELGEAADVVSRTSSHALKLGLIYAALENDSPVIEDGQIEAGILAAEFAQGCALLLLEEIGDSKTVKLEARIMRKLEKEPGVTKRDLQRAVCGRNFGSEMYNKAVKAMLETGKIVVREEDGGLLAVGGGAW